MVDAAEVTGMPKVTLYMKDADAPIWERARQLAGENGLSAVVSRALAAYVNEHEKRATATSELERRATTITLQAQPDGGPQRKVRFTGVRAGESDQFDAYVTTGGKVVLDDRDGGVFVCDGYEDFTAMSPEDNEIRAAVAESLGKSSSKKSTREVGSRATVLPARAPRCWCQSRSWPARPRRSRSRVRHP